MKSSLHFISQLGLLTTTTIAATIPYQTYDTAGIVQSPSNDSLSFSSVTGTWTYPTTLDNPGEGPAPYFFSQYVGMDLLPGTCGHGLELGTNITLANDGTRGGYGYYKWNNVSTPIEDDNGDIVQFLDGDTVTVKIWLGDLEQGAFISFNSTRSGYIFSQVIGGNLCQENVQWAVGSVKNHWPPYFESTNFADCEAGEIENGSGNGAPDVATVTPEGGSLVYLVVDYEGVANIQADPHCPSGSQFDIESQPDDETGPC